MFSKFFRWWKLLVIKIASKWELQLKHCHAFAPPDGSLMRDEKNEVVKDVQYYEQAATVMANAPFINELNDLQIQYERVIFNAIAEGKEMSDRIYKARLILKGIRIVVGTMRNVSNEAIKQRLKRGLNVP